MPAFVKMVFFLVLFACLVSACADKQPKETEPAKTASQPKTAEAPDYHVPAPKVFGISLDMPPSQIANRLMELGYERTSWELDAPYSKQTYVLPDTKATFQHVELRTCNHPFSNASLTVSGQDADHFYQAVRERYGFGISEWEMNEKSDYKRGTYTRQFAKKVWATLRSTPQGATFSLEARDVLAQCQKALVKDMDEFKKSEQDAVKAQRLRQRETF